MAEKRFYQAEAFQDADVVAAYSYRPSYPPELFTLLLELITGELRTVLDVGAGSGDIARHLVEQVERVDAVDFSRSMIELGQRLPNGNHPQLHWLYGRVEEVELQPPYALITAGQSLHWMDEQIVLPRFHDLLQPGAYLAIIRQRTTPDPWSIIGEVVTQYRIDKYRLENGKEPPTLLEDLEQQGLFKVVGEQQTSFITTQQSIDDYIESYHGRSSFSRARMGTERARAFDEEAKEALLKIYPDGIVPVQAAAHVVWGRPSRGVI